MQIQLRQNEIVDALKQYITQQGFSLAGKSVTVSFTASRNGAGVSADVAIDGDVTIPGLDDDEEESKPALSVVKSAPAAVEVQPAPVAATAMATEVIKAESVVVAPPAVEAKSSTSLFS